MTTPALCTSSWKKIRLKIKSKTKIVKPKIALPASEPRGRKRKSLISSWIALLWLVIARRRKMPRSSMKIMQNLRRKQLKKHSGKPLSLNRKNWRTFSGLLTYNKSQQLQIFFKRKKEKIKRLSKLCLLL